MTSWIPLSTTDVRMDRCRIALCALAGITTFGFAATTYAGPDERDQAYRIHNRLAGVPPSELVLTQMEADLLANDPIAAARRAMENPNFYTVTVKNFAAPWTNRDQSVFVPLNDYTTLVIGMVMDGVPLQPTAVG